MNRYNYCIGSWLNYQDPSGDVAQIVGGLIIGAMVGLVSGVVSEVITKSEMGEDYNSEEWGLRILNSTISGAAGEPFSVLQVGPPAELPVSWTV